MKRSLMTRIILILSIIVIINLNLAAASAALSGINAGKKLVEYLNGRTGGGVEYVSYADRGNIYEINVFYQGQNILVYITKDGKYFVQGAVSIDNSINTKTLSSKKAGKKLVDYLNNRTGGGVAYVSSVSKGNIYEVKVSYEGQNILGYITKDGKYFVQGAVPITINNKNTRNCRVSSDCKANQICKLGICVNKLNPPEDVTVPKSERPVVEAFVFSYCPYGLQFEKALFPVYDLLKNKSDINIVYIGMMHGEFEYVESLRQISILKLYNKDKLFAYLKEFDTNSDIGACSGDDTCLDKYLLAIYTKLGIDKAKVKDYMTSSAEKIYQDDEARASKLGISGSPTFVINGVEVQVSRTPDAIKKAVCNAFNTAPSECSQTLSTSPTSAGFGGASTDSGSGSQYC